MTKRTHAELIHQWAEGARIQFFGLNGWQDQDSPQWMPTLKYRVLLAEFPQEAGSHMAHIIDGVYLQVNNTTKDANTVTITAHKEV